MNKKSEIRLLNFSNRWRGFWILIICFGALPLYATAQDAPAGKKSLSASKQRKLDYFYYEGLTLKNAAKFDAAYEIFKYCLEIDSTSSVVLYELASFYLQMEQPEKAASLLKQAVAYSPDNYNYRLALASVSLDLGMYGEASEEYEILVKQHPDKLELNYYLAEAYIQEGEIGKAIDIFDELEGILGMKEPFSMQKYQLYMTLKEPGKAFDELKKLAAKYPNNARYLILIGDLYLEQNDTEKALENYGKAHVLEPDNPYYTVSMANYYKKAGNPEAAEEQIRLALINDKLDVELKVGILSRYIQQIQQSGVGTETANTLFQTLLEQHPEDTELKLIYAGLLVLQKNTEEARFQLRLVTEMEPENEKAWQQLLGLSFQVQDLDDAVRICLKCRELFPESMEYHFYLGIAYSQQDKYQEALDIYHESLKLIPETNKPLRSDYYGQIGDIYYQMKRPEEAFASYEEALKYNERNVVILNNYSYYLSLEKRDLDKAERLSAQCIKMAPDNATYLDTYAWIFFVKGNYALAKIYIVNAIEKDTTNSPELVDHYGDILYKTGDREGALKQWIKAKEMGKATKTLEQKIEKGIYIDAQNDEK
ncbi:MAG: tetratricopeptide repeat protein [Tannerella sp.]|nr:tetratricopeptide repeat protein [Tannerella sp.]